MPPLTPKQTPQTSFQKVLNDANFLAGGKKLPPDRDKSVVAMTPKVFSNFDEPL